MATAAKRTDDGLPTGIDVAAFLAWVRDHPGRYELHDGDVFAMAPARVQHGVAKFAIQRALLAAVREARLPCHVMPDGIAVHVSDQKWYEPDALVYCGPEAHGDDDEIKNPLIVVEVVSPSTGRLDATDKLRGYFSLSSVRHYMIVYTKTKHIVHHERQDDGTILTRIVTAGPLQLDPPGLTVDLTEILS